MASTAKTTRDNAEIDLRLQIENLGREVTKESRNYRKLKLEMNRTEEKMQILKSAHANWCKQGHLQPGDADSMSFLRPLSSLYEEQMDEADIALAESGDATSAEALEEYETEIAKLKCDVECKRSYFNTVKDKEITPQVHAAVRKNQALVETWLQNHGKVLKVILPCLTPGTERNNRKTEEVTWYTPPPPTQVI